MLPWIRIPVFGPFFSDYAFNECKAFRQLSDSERTGDASSSGPELRDDRRDVVMLFLKTESPNTIHDCGQQSLARQISMLLKRFNQAPLTQFLSSLVTGFGY